MACTFHSLPIPHHAASPTLTPPLLQLADLVEHQHFQNFLVDFAAGDCCTTDPCTSIHHGGGPLLQPDPAPDPPSLLPPPTGATPICTAI